jgi:hypothetical protein
MPNILGHKRNANQNDIELSPHSSQNGYHQEHKDKCGEDAGRKEVTVGGKAN